MSNDVLLHRYIIPFANAEVNGIWYYAHMTLSKTDKELISLLSIPRSTKEWDMLLNDLLTPQERDSLIERWQIIQLLHKGIPQREIAKKLGVSISKITRGSRVLQEGKGSFLSALEQPGTSS